MKATAPALLTRPRPAGGRSRQRLGVTPLEPRTTPAFLGGVSLAVADVNGDGYPDVVAGQAADGAPLVRVIDGKTGTQALEFFAYAPSFTGGVYVAAGDVDGDGRAEIVTGTGNGGGPHVRVLDGVTGEERYGFFPYEESFRGGVIVAAGDTDGDGKAEVITGTGVGGGPRVQIIDPATQRQRANFFAYEDTFRGGVLVGAGDLDGDGKAEVITGTGVGGGPRVQAFNAATLAPVLNFFAYEDTFRGGVLIAAGDTDGDGLAEVLTGTGPGGGPVVTVFGGQDGRQRSRFAAADPGFRGGVTVAAGDLTADGAAEVLTGLGRGGPPTVTAFTADGASTLASFSPFDPVALPAPTPLSKTFRRPPGASVVVPAAPAGLAVSPTQVPTGSAQQLVFTAKFAGPTPTRVQLFQSTATGAAGEFLLDLFDDGDFAHRDARAGDGVFSNTFTPAFAAAGDTHYLARATTGGATASSSAKVTAVARPSDNALRVEYLSQSFEANALEDGLVRAVSEGTPLADALAQARADLLARPALYRPGTVAVSDRGLYWESPAGIPMGVLASTRVGDEWSDGGAGPTGPAAVTLEAGDAHECQGKAVVLEPYLYEGVVKIDNRPTTQGLAIADQLQAAGYQVDYKASGGGLRGVTVESYKKLSRYDAVVVLGHGDQKPGIGGQPVVLTGEPVTLDSLLTYSDDVLARPARMTVVDDVWALTPAFFEKYSGQMHHDSVVYFSTCRGAFEDGSVGATPQFAQTFLGLGAGGFVGYTDYVNRTWAARRGINLFRDLLAGKTVETFGENFLSEPTFPGYGPEYARIQAYVRGIDSKLDPHCDPLADYDLFVRYTWPSSQKDLDTGTQFLGKSVGFSHPGSPYMTFSGDNTGKGGVETVTIDLHGAYRAGGWTKTADVGLRAGWYAPSKGAGEALVTVSLKKKGQQEYTGSEVRQIQPGSQSGAAVTPVGRVQVFVSGPAGEEEVSFELE